MFLVRISNKLQIATFNRQLSDLIRQCSAINFMGDLMDVANWRWKNGHCDDLRSSLEVDRRSIWSTIKCAWKNRTL